MRSLWTILPALIFAIPVSAEPIKPALSAKQLAEGWVQLFDGESTYGWKVDGKAEVKDGKLVWSDKTTIATHYSLPNGTLNFGQGDYKASRIHRGGVAKIVYDPSIKALEYIHFQPDDTTSIFNGKDLTGWKVFADPKRSASKIEVTKEGEIHVTNGPGDLQTEKKYGNFMLQFECYSNGDGLNSGIFFRCIADQYQNGYECQIQNKFKDGDRTKPADFGTGAIYRREPARKVMADDKTWFHMTLLANGPEFTTWVNGYPVLHWVDKREKDENPRKGLRLEPGHLSIQGHDPTTDLKFKNFKIVEIK